MGIQTHFDNFHNKIKLGREDEAYKKARERDDSIKKEVISAFASAGYPVVNDFNSRFAQDTYWNRPDIGRL